MSRAAIAELEAGRIKQPRAGVFARLARTLGIPVALLLAAGGIGDSDAAGRTAAEADEVVAMAIAMVQMAGHDRGWLRDRMKELRELLILRKTEPPRRGQR